MATHCQSDHLCMSSQGTQPAADITRYHDINFTVHDFAHHSTSPPRTSQSTVLSEGYQVIQAAIFRGSRWRNVEIPAKDNNPTPANAFIYNKLPPSVLLKENSVIVLKEWGAQVTEDEEFNLEDLEDFEVINLGYNEPEHAVGYSSPVDTGAQQKRTRTASPAVEPEFKRRKLNVGPLYRFIPKPHIHPSPFFSSECPLKGRPFKKSEPVFISPYTAFSLADDARVAWLIPIRGLFPWDNCTPGALLDSCHDGPSLPESDQILWTDASLLKFWEFLLQLRKNGSLGPLGVSFHGAPQHKHSATPHNLGSHLSFPPPASVDVSLYPRELQTDLSTVDYIKVYHDASRAFYVRNALDIWSFQPDNAQKVRIFKGARLALVDEASEGVLIV